MKTTETTDTETLRATMLRVYAGEEMQPEIRDGALWLVDTCEGFFCVPAEVCDDEAKLGEHVVGPVTKAECLFGYYSRLAKPGAPTDCGPEGNEVALMWEWHGTEDDAMEAWIDYADWRIKS